MAQTGPTSVIKMLAKNLFLAILALAFEADAFWRLECRGRVGLARIDPLVNFGKPSQHVHAIHGSSGEFRPSFARGLLFSQPGLWASEMDKFATSFLNNANTCLHRLS